MNISIKIDTEKLKTAIKKEPAISIQELNNAIKKSILKTQSLSQKSAPVNTGALRQSIQSRFEPLRGIIEAKAKYSLYVHEGTRAHDIFPVRKMALANVRKGQFFGRHVKHPGTKPNRFMTRAIVEAKQWIIEYFNQAINNIVKKII